jgi:histidinol-phosphate aminotransferase
MNPDKARTTNFLELAAPAVRGLHPYVPGKPVSELEREYGVKDIVKLTSNENPLGPGPRARAALQGAIADAGFYPDGGGFALKDRLARLHGVGAECITLGNGSNDVLVLLAEAFLTPESEAVYSQYGFAVYPIAVQATGAKARVALALPATHAAMPLGHDLQAMSAMLGAHTRLVFVANPNNPTGTWLDTDSLRQFIAAAPPTALVVVDEAYFDYSREVDCPDASAWLADFPNLVVVRTFSKAYGLAGLRVGYALSHPQVAEILNRLRQPFNVNTPALAAAEAALDDVGHLRRTIELNRAGLRQLGEGLRAMGLQVAPSAGNFLLVDLGRPAAPINDSLLRQAVIARPVGNYGLPNHLRVSTGTGAQNGRFLSALAAALRQ